MSTRQQVKTFPNLTQAAFQNKDTARLRVYYLLKHLDDQGCGWVLVDDAVTFVSQVCNVQPDYVHRLLKDGEPYWMVGKGRVWLRSWTEIMRHFRATDDEGSVLVPLEDFGKLSKCRASLYATFFVTRPVTHCTQITVAGKQQLKATRVRPRKVIARQTLSNLLDVTKATQRRYEKLTKRLKVYPSVVYAENVPDPADFPDLEKRAWFQCGGRLWQCRLCAYSTGNRREAKRHAGCHKKSMRAVFGRPQHCHVRASARNRAWLDAHVAACHGAGEELIELMWQGPNTFLAEFQRGDGRWSPRRARRMIDSASPVNGTHSSAHSSNRGGERSPIRKLVFWTRAAAERALKRGREAVQVFKGTRERHGQLEYAYAFLTRV